MAFTGQLITIGSYNVPLNVMIAQSYSVTYSVLDLDSYRDANGVLHRNAIRKVPQVSVTLEPRDSSTIATIFQNIASQFTSSAERKVTATVFIPETNGYYTGDFYLPDIQFTIDYIKNNTVYYEPVTLELIGY